MNKVKGSGNVILKKVLEERAIDVAKDFVPRLSPESQAIFNKLAVSWVDIPLEKKGSTLYEAAQLLFPGPEEKGLTNLGLLMAKKAPIFYQIFLSIPTKEFVFKKLPQLYRSFYDTGLVEVLYGGGKECTLVIKDYPDFPRYMQWYMCGWLEGFFSIIKLKITSVKADASDPQAWKWTMVWA